MATVWELDDPVTGPTPSQLKAFNMDAAKFLLRVSHDDADSLKTIRAAVDSIRGLNAQGLPTFLSPLPVRKGKSTWDLIPDAGEIARLCSVATALGDSSRMLWLPVPYCDGFEVVSHATTLPILVADGQVGVEAPRLLEQIALGLGSGSNIRGAMLGFNALYPGDIDPLNVALAVNDLIHNEGTLEQAIATLENGQKP